MSFYPQPNKYQCGPFALKYALVMLGIFTSEKSIARKAGSSWWHGTDEIGLEEAAKYYDCRFKYFRREVGQDAIKVLVQHLKRGFPCILSVDNWGHWITVINWQQGKFILMDSSKDKVIKIYSAKQLISRWKFIDPDDEFKSFDGYALIPNFKPRTRAKFTLAKQDRTHGDDAVGSSAGVGGAPVPKSAAASARRMGRRLKFPVRCASAGPV